MVVKRRFKDDYEDGAAAPSSTSPDGTRAAVAAAVQAATAAAAAARGTTAPAAATTADAALVAAPTQTSSRPTTAATAAPSGGSVVSELPGGLAAGLRQAADVAEGGDPKTANVLPTLGPALDAIARSGRLVLVIDVEACLIDATLAADLSREEEAALDRASRGEAGAGVPAEARSLRWHGSSSNSGRGGGGARPSFWVKLRPGARRFLASVAERFELWAVLTSGGGLAAAAATLSCLDPAGALFGGRVLPLPLSSSSSGEPPRECARVLRALEDRAPAAFVLGDGATISTLAAAMAEAMAAAGAGSADAPPLALVPVERYSYFGATRRRDRLPGPSLAEMGIDEDPERGALAMAARCLEDAHKLAIERWRDAAGAATPATNGYSSASLLVIPGCAEAVARCDARRVVSDERRRTLKGCLLAFDPRVAQRSGALWRLAEQHGAECAEAAAAAAAPLPKGLTHLVVPSRASCGSERAAAARAMGAVVVGPAWVEHACLSWRTPAAERFAPPA
jgi:hypothetical protein